MPLGVAAQSEAGNGNVKDHKQQHDPSEDLSHRDGEPFNPAGEQGVDYLKPDHRSDSPEKAVQKIDAPTQVEGEMAVVPKYRTKHQFREDGAGVLVSAANNGTNEKYVAVAAVTVFLQ